MAPLDQSSRKLELSAISEIRCDWRSFIYQRALQPVTICHQLVDYGGYMNTQKCRVTKDYQAEFADPIAVTAGEMFAVSEKRSLWENNPEWMWVWCTDQRGKSGWTPKKLIQLSEDGRVGTSLVDYDARELTVVAGQELMIEMEESGWYWCCNQAGEYGWVPISHVVLCK